MAPQAQTQATPKPDAKFVFRTKSVELDGPSTEAHRYRIEGVTINGWRFLLDCSDFPPASALKGDPADEIQKIEQYRDTEEFRKVVLEKVGWASLSPRRDRMVLYRNVVSMQDAIRAHTPLDEPFADCPIVNRIENGADIVPVRVLSSQFRSWKRSMGYEVEAQTGQESLTLGCTEGKGAVCTSLAPNTYRATRTGAQMRLYDADLTLVGVYRIVKENALLVPDPGHR